MLPTGRVVWRHARAGERLAIAWAVPDCLRGDGVLHVSTDEREIAALEIPTRGDAMTHELVIDTPDIVGQEVPREGQRQAATMALDAVWR